MTPYYSDESVTLHHGDMREVLPALGVVADVCITDPPYGETSLEWDSWPKGWPYHADDLRRGFHRCGDCAEVGCGCVLTELS